MRDSGDQQNLCFALSLWNGQDRILKERLFGLSGSEGNHGEDVKEYYFYLDSTPTHSYMKMLYKYPQRAFPYADLVETNRRRGKHAPEYELIDTDSFAENRYFDVLVEYAKSNPEDILIRVTAFNRGPEPAELHILPTLWFRNTWGWGSEHDKMPRPTLKEVSSKDKSSIRWIEAEHANLGRYLLAFEDANTLLFTENETNNERLHGSSNQTLFVKDAFHAYVMEGSSESVNPECVGTKAAALYQSNIAPGESISIRLRLMKAGDEKNVPENPFASFETISNERQAEADEFYAAIQPASLTEDDGLIQRQAFAGML